MSLTAHLLHNRPTILPNGSLRAHYIEPPVIMTKNQVTAWRIKSANVERVYKAVADGHQIIDDIMAATRLSQTTVQKALNILNTWPGGRRCTYTRLRNRGGNPYRWTVVDDGADDKAQGAEGGFIAGGSPGAAGSAACGSGKGS